MKLTRIRTYPELVKTSLRSGHSAIYSAVGVWNLWDNFVPIWFW
jgi:hypothetical protein